MRSKFMLVSILALAFGGCATGNSKMAGTDSKINARMTRLEDRLGEQQREIESLKIELQDMTREDYSMEGNTGEGYPKVLETRVSPVSVPSGGNKSDTRVIRVAVDSKDVQLALKNAGYYKGKIDGKFGANSQEAVSAFQRDHGLKADGIVGRKTWGELEKYLE